MTKEEIEIMENLKVKFEAKCRELCKQLVRLNCDFSYVGSFSLEDAVVTCTGGYSSYGEWTDVGCCFPTSLLYASDDEVEKYVVTKLKEKEEKEAEAKKASEQRQKQLRFEQYKKLKAEFESSKDVEAK